MKPKVRFRCTGNSCRSRMAEAWANQGRGDRLEAWSAGTRPRSVDPLAIRAMEEHGIDITAARSKHARELLGTPFDRAVTVCDTASRECTMFPGKAGIVHRGFDDPPTLAEEARTDEERMAPYRRACREPRERVLTLPEAFDDQPR